MFLSDCPRCGSKRTTFDLLAATFVGTENYRVGYECFLKCRSCSKPSNGLLRTESNAITPTQKEGVYINDNFDLEGWVFEVPGSRKAPEYVPTEIERIFKEGSDCFAIGAYDAAGTMFRKVLDAATRAIAAPPDATTEPKTPNWKTYKDLRLRLDWLFSNGLLDRSLEDLSSCIHQDGNDAAHDLEGIGVEEAEDLSDFADQVLRVIFTMPGQIVANRKRREQRRGNVEMGPS